MGSVKISLFTLKHLFKTTTEVTSVFFFNRIRMEEGMGIFHSFSWLLNSGREKGGEYTTQP